MDLSKILDSWGEIHRLQLGVATALIATWLNDNDHDTTAWIIVGGGTLIVYGEYGLRSWHAHPWYYLLSLGGLLWLLDRRDSE